MSEKKTNCYINLSRKYSKKYFKKNLKPHHKFHNYRYVRKTVKQINNFVEHYSLENEKIELLKITIYFLFTGRLKTYSNYQESSVQIARDFLERQQYPEEKINQVETLILCTKDGHKPDSLMQEIIHDASILYFGQKSFFKKSELLRIEQEEINEQIINAKEWANQQYDHLINVRFYTKYAIEKHQSKLASNIIKQRKQILKVEKANIRKKTGKEFGRGIDTLYRVTYRNHINLSSIADGKANMMISINTLILSAIIALMSARITFSQQYTFMNVNFLIPILILLIGVLASGVLAILSVRPKVTSSDISSKDIIKRSKSILFFGNFINMDLSEFIENMDLLKRNHSVLYDNMAVDIYYLGQVLDEKYRLIRFSYNVFMIALILCVFSFICIIYFYKILGVVQ